MPKKKRKLLKSPIRYPGSKRFLDERILQYIPPFKEFREPFFGSGALSLRVAQLFPEARIRAWDLDGNLMNFWRAVRNFPEALSERVRQIYDAGLDRLELAGNVTAPPPGRPNLLDQAAKFFVINRSSWSGCGIHKGITNDSYETLFTESSIAGLVKTPQILQNIEFNTGDFAQALHGPSEEAFIFADPPYVIARDSKLYTNHTIFEPWRVRDEFVDCGFRVLISFDASPVIRKIFRGPRWYIEDLKMKPRASTKKDEVTELLIANYDLRAVAAANAALR